MLLIPNKLGAIAKIAAKEAHPRYGVSGVKVMSYGDGTYRAEATDTRRLIICTGPAESAEDYPVIPALASAPNGKIEGIIPAKEFAAACTTVKKYKTHKPILEHLGLVFGENQTTLASTDLETTSCNTVRNVEGRWVPSNDILPTGGSA